MLIATSSPGRFSLALEVGQGKAPWGRGCSNRTEWSPVRSVNIQVITNTAGARFFKIITSMITD